jgi:UDP-N-acetylglucosamine 2-epimerase (non-hydrolysing)
MLIHLVCAARPNFMKVAPLYHALKREEWATPLIVHTGQHYDPNMSDSFFEDLAMPKPDIYLGVGSGSHAEQTAKVMIAYEKILFEHRPDLVIVVGDVNSTMAATLAAAKIVYPITQSPDPLSPSVSRQPCTVSPEPSAVSQPNKPFNPLRRPLVAHLEAGLRSFDRDMPEEINRLVTDVLADMLWVPSRDAIDNLVREGVSAEKIQFVGNIMIDSLEMLRLKIEAQKAHLALGLEAGGYGVVTLHRPSNVDDPHVLKTLCSSLQEISEKVRLVFPVHPRTRKKLEEAGILSAMAASGRLHMPEPMNYVRFMSLVFNCRFVITDSGGIQEETSYLGIPCLTVRENTERPITITHGTNQLCKLEDLKQKTDDILKAPARVAKKIELWDGKTADRIVALLSEMK